MRYTMTQMEVAYKSVKEDGIPLKVAARLHGVPKSTLRDRLIGRVSLHRKRNTFFSQSEENEILSCIELVNKIGYGCTRSELQAMASNYAVHLGRLEEGNELKPHWIASFLKRWPSVLLTSKVKNASSAAVEHYYSELANLIKKYSCTSQSVFIVSEKEICLDHEQPCVLSTPAIRAHPESKRKKCVTLTAAANTSGEAIPPFFVLPVEEESAFTLLEGTLPNTGFTFSETGASDPATMKEYVGSHMSNHIQPPADSHVLLLYDSPRCPLPLELKEVALDSRFVLYYVTPPREDSPGNTDHLHPLSQTVKEACSAFLRDHPECTLSTDNICQLACKAYTEALTPVNIEQAFQQMGIFDS